MLAVIVAGAASFVVEERAVGTVPQGASPIVASDPTGRRVAHLVTRGRKVSIALNGVVGPAFDAITNRRGFSPDGERYAYEAALGGTRRLVVGAARQPALDGVKMESGALRFARGGTLIALLKDGAKERWSVGGKPGPAYGQLFPLGLAFSDDGRTVAYAAREGEGRDYVVGLGAVRGPYAGVSGPLVSPDGKRSLFAFRNASGARAVIDGVEGPVFERVADLALSPNGSHCAYVVRWGGADRLVLDGTVQDEGFDAAAGTLVGDDGRLHAVVQKGDAFFVVDGARRHGPYRKVESLVLSGDGRTLAFSALDGEDSFLVVDGVATKVPQIVPKSLLLSRDGRRTAVLGRSEGQDELWIDGHVAVRAASLEGASLRMGPDGTVVVHGAPLGSQPPSLFVDGVAAGRYPFLGSGVGFLGGGGVRFLVRRGRRIVQVTVRPRAQSARSSPAP